jgi:hypothetical protein
MIEYPLDLDPDFVVDTELDDLFTAIETYINVTKLSQKHFEHGSVRYRHLEEPPAIELAQPFIDLEINNGVAYGGYYLCEGTILEHDTSIGNAPNRDIDDQPVYQIHAFLFASNIGIVANSYTGARIGWYDGITWIALSTTHQDLGLSCGEVIQPYASTTMQHYWTGAADYRPFNIPYDRGVVLSASFGGDVRHNGATAPQKFAILVNNIECGEWSKGIIYLNARENVF